MSHFCPDTPLYTIDGKMSKHWLDIASIANPRLNRDQVIKLWEEEAAKQEDEINIALGNKWPPQYPAPEPEVLITRAHLALLDLPRIAGCFMLEQDHEWMEREGYFG